MLDIDLILLLITLVTFIFLIRYLNGKLYIPLLKYMEDRDNELKGNVDSANQNLSDIEALQNRTQTVLLEARQEATSSKEKTISDVKAEIAQKMEVKKNELAENFKVYMETLEQERVSLKNRLLADSEAIELALKDRFNSI